VQVQKSFARLCFLDIAAARGGMDAHRDAYARWAAMPVEKTYEDKELETALKSVAGPLYTQKVAPTCELSKNIGNTYTASVYMNLANIVSSQGAALAGKSLTLFSYGSGALATMLEIRGATPAANGHAPFTLQQIQEALNLPARLASRERLMPVDLTAALEVTCCACFPRVPSSAHAGAFL
jgi:hydroxymethylglutaryl-CoA synthase